MENGETNPEDAVKGELVRQFANTPIFWIVTIAGLVSTPLSLLSQYGFHWIAIFLFLATSLWWYLEVWRPTSRVSGQGSRHVYSLTKRLLCGLLPLTCFLAFISLVVWRSAGLEFFRKEYEQDQIEISERGTITKYFGESTSERTTPSERARHDRDDWIRLLEKGAQQVDAGADILFIRTKPFTKDYQTLVVEAHNPGNKVAPTLHGAAFLVHDPLGGGGNRVYRETPCRPDPDGISRLFRIDIQKPNSGEELWLFLSVKPTMGPVAFDTLNLQMMVYR